MQWVVASPRVPAGFRPERVPQPGLCFDRAAGMGRSRDRVLCELLRNGGARARMCIRVVAGVMWAVRAARTFSRFCRPLLGWSGLHQGRRRHPFEPCQNELSVRVDPTYGVVCASC